MSSGGPHVGAEADDDSDSLTLECVDQKDIAIYEGRSS